MQLTKKKPNIDISFKMNITEQIEKFKYIISSDGTSKENRKNKTSKNGIKEKIINIKKYRYKNKKLFN